MAISSSGIGSGLDVNSIVTQLMTAESAPLNILKTKASSFNAKLSAYGTLKSAISTFQTTLKDLTGSGLTAQTATTSNPSMLGVSAGSTATPGVYAIEVTQLAQQHKLMSPGVTDATAPLGGGRGAMTIEVGGKSVDIPAGDYSLQGISNAINAANAGVSATIVNNGDATLGNHLVITATDSGVVNSVKITADANSCLSQFQFDPAAPLAAGTVMLQKQEARNAKFTIDNIEIEKPSNTITDAINGITLNLLQANVGTTVNVTVAHDKSAAKTALTGFVDAYNKLNSTVKKMTSYDAGSKTGAVLNGDSGAASILLTLRKQLSNAVTGAASLTTLSDIGIAFQRDGTLSVDDVKLQKALDGKFDNIAKLFSGADGFATRLSTATADMLGAKGVITSRTDGLNTSIKGLSARQAEVESRLALTEKRYRAQFTALDATISKMQSTSSFLTQQLTALAKNQ